MTIQVFSPDVIKKRIQDIVRETPDAKVTPGIKGLVNNEITKAIQLLCKEMDLDPLEGRYLIFGWLFGSDDTELYLLHTADLSGAAFNALYQWVKPGKVGDDWLPRAAFGTECCWVLTRAAWCAAMGLPLGELKNIMPPRGSIDVDPGEPLDIPSLIPTDLLEMAFNLGAVPTKELNGGGI